MAIFGKTDQAPPPAPVTERPSTAGGITSAPAPATLIGPRARFIGEMSGDDDVLLQGRFEGNIRAARTVTVAASGELKGDVSAKFVVVGGRVHGQIRAEEKAELLASCSVQGNVSAPKVVIAEGAQLQGNVTMSATGPPVPGIEEHTKET